MAMLGLRGDRLLHALSEHLDLRETKVTDDGRVETRLYRKYGLKIRERVHLPSENDEADLAVEDAPRSEESSDPEEGPSSDLKNLAVAVKSADRRPALVHEIAPRPSPLAPIRETLVELRDLLSGAGDPPLDNSAEPGLDVPASPAAVVYGVLSGKHIALVGSFENQTEALRRGFEDQFSEILILDWSEIDAAAEMLAGQDLVVIRLDPDEDGRRLDFLASLNKPTLLAGDLTSLSQLNPEYSGTPFDFVAPPFHVAEVAWRAANLLTPASGSGDAAPVEEDTPAPEIRTTTRVLIAEDDPATATLLATVLASHGMECHVARNGVEALEMVKGKQIDVSILEVGLSGLDGFQILAALKRDPELENIPVVFLTARQSEADILRAFQLGADDYITKPFSPMEVAARLKRLLGRPR